MSLVVVHDQIGNGRFGEVRKAEVTSICEESPLQNIACIKVFQGNETPLKLQLFLLLISTEIQTGHCLPFCVYVRMYAESQSNNMQKTEALRRVEFKKNVAPHVNIINYLGACSSGKKGMCLLHGGEEHARELSAR